MSATTSEYNNVASDLSVNKSKQDAFSLWSTAGDATNKECALPILHISNRSHSFRGRRGRLLSTEFMLSSSKRHYMDYYWQIQNLVTLYEIKSWTETENYDRKLCRPRRSQIGPGALLQEREDIQHEG